MNRLKTTNNGGVPFDWDDWRWEQDGVREAFFGLLSAWGIDPDDSFIISGCTSTPNGLNFDIAEGFIALNGEIYKVNAHSVVAALGGGDTHFWEEVISFDPTGLEPTKNAGAVDTYEIRQANVINGTIPVPTFMPMVAETIHKKVADGIQPFFGQWITIDLNGSTNVVQNDGIDGAGNSIALVSTPNAGSFLKYSIIGKTIHISFFIEGIRTTTKDVQNALTFILTSLPFNFKTGVTQFGLFNSVTSDPGTNNRTGDLLLSSNKIVFQKRTPKGLISGINSFYQRTTETTTKNWELKPFSNIEVDYELRGNFVAEID